MNRRRKRRKRKLNQRGLLLVLAVLGVVLVLLMNSLLHESYTYDPVTEVPEVYHETRPALKYDMEKVISQDGFYTYEDDEYTSVIGIDVSAHNKELDWAQIKASGVSFAMIRCGYRGYTEGYIQDDEYFDTNIQGALDNGIQVGVYFFSQAVNEEEAAEEAKYVIEKIHDYPITWPVVYDYEFYPESTGARGNYINRAQRTKCAEIFLENIKNAGYTPMIYASTDTYSQLFQPEYLTEYAFWVAQYNTYCSYPYDYFMWQYTDQGGVQGLPAGLDLNIAFLKKEQ